MTPVVAFTAVSLCGKLRGYLKYVGRQEVPKKPLPSVKNWAERLAIVDGNALLGGERLELGVIEQAE